jgi:hypothetical protein
MKVKLNSRRPPNPRLFETTNSIISAGLAVFEMAGDIINTILGFNTVLRFYLTSYAVTIETIELSIT